MLKNTKKGFTLIELLVVIAIIGILSSVVLASLNSGRAKAANAAVKSNLMNARPQAELFYLVNGDKYYNSTTATDVCNAAGSVGSNPAVKSIAVHISAAAAAAGIPQTVIEGGSSGGSEPQTITSANCNPTATTWVAQVPLKQATGGFTYWCVDNTGASVGTSTPLVAGITKC